MRTHYAFAVGLSLTIASPALAQIRASEIGSMSQIIDGTKITMEYSRPRARGRTPLFGGRVVRWDEVWTPGANWATTFETSKDLTLGGKRVPKGKYSVWMVVKENGNWTTVLDPEVRRYHMEPPDSSATQIRIPVRPAQGPFTEVLTWSVPDVTAGGGTLAMNWGTTLIAMDVVVQPSFALTMPAADAAPYLGRYEYIPQSGPEKGKKSVLFVTYEHSTLKGRWEPNDPYMKTFALIRIAPDWFAPGVYDDKGQVYEVYKPEMTFEFTVKDGKAVTLEIRSEDDKIDAVGRRLP
ncbi:MAG TPA: DUF2911 domain-containing protein [Gemmatimonadaceae bacterium]|nr:DUF2911 domain-containing protein [Gemmatimonadaceae bacterium]